MSVQAYYLNLAGVNVICIRLNLVGSDLFLAVKLT